MSQDTPSKHEIIANGEATAFLPTGGNVGDYAFSPDSSKIAYIAEQNVDNVRELFVVDLGAGTLTSQKVNGTFTSLLSNVMSFRWSADSAHIAYVANEEDPDVFDLFVSNVSGAAPTARANISNSSSGQMIGTQYAWSPTSSTLAYSIFGFQIEGPMNW